MTASDEQRAQKLYGCSLEYKNSLPDDVVKKYTAHRSRAANRGIGWEFTLLEWWDIWEPYWSNRGARRNNYVMARKGDVGPYSADNVRIKTSGENIAEYYENFRSDSYFESLIKSIKNDVELSLKTATEMQIFFSDKTLLKQACTERNLEHRKMELYLTSSFEKLSVICAAVLIDWMMLWKAAETDA